MSLIYNGIEYDVGTKVKIKTLHYGEQIMILEQGGVTGLQFVGNNYFSIPLRSNTTNLIIEIVEPIYSQKTINDGKTSNKHYPSPWDIETGWIWYIIIMVVGTIFRDRLLIWFFATALFFLWKNGKLGGNK